MENRKQRIKEKGFSMAPQQDSYSGPVDFSKVKVGLKTLSDATLQLSNFGRVSPRIADKEYIMRVMHDGDLRAMREISNFFYKTSGIYNRLCRYMAYLYRYDWHVTPYILKDSAPKQKIIDDFNSVLKYLDDFEVKRFLGDTALKVVKNGCYYGYIIDNGGQISIQELDPNYCRTRYSVANRPAVEFNMKFFVDSFSDEAQRKKILGLFPDEFKKGYDLYKQGKLPEDYPGDDKSWYLLDINKTIKFNMNGCDYPMFIPVIPAIIDLDEAQELDKKKMKQRLLKIIIQKMPIDKNGDLVFDVEEARELHNNVVQMLAKAIGVDVLTTFADVEVADMADKNTTTTVDDLAKVERGVYNEAGVPKNVFNSDGSIALEKSVLNDEASMYNLITQYESFLNYLIKKFNKNSKKYYFKAQILPTTIYNYKDLAKQYKEHTQLGYSKMLPQIALGQSQSSILANAHFENDVLDLVNVFIPPLMSSTMNAEILNRGKGGSGESGAGRPELDDDKKSEKTIANIESQS